jgi:Sigma-70, region 4
VRVERLGLSPATLDRLHQAGIVNLTQLTSHSIVGLMQHPDLGPPVVYEVMRSLSKHGLALPTPYGWSRIPNQRTLEMFRLRFVEGLTLTQTGQRFGVSRPRVDQILNAHFCISTLPAAPTRPEPQPKAST